MTILNDREIAQLAIVDDMIAPFVGSQRRVSRSGRPVISFGASSFGYDARLAPEFRRPLSGVIDPKNPESCLWDDMIAEWPINIEPHDFLLARTVEYFRIPDDVMAICIGKSTYARCGLIVNVTPLEPGWEGHVTLELSNTTHLPITIYPDEGICQFVFFRGERPAVTYGDRGGKYQGQTGVTLAKV